MKITGKGIPTRKTAGAIGDIYTDTLTGLNYECTFAYSPNGKNDYDYEWKPTDAVVGIDISNGPDMTAVEEVAKESFAEKEKELLEDDKETIPEKSDVKKQNSKNHVNYAKAFNTNKKETK